VVATGAAPAPVAAAPRLRTIRLFLLLAGVALTAQGAVSLALAAAGAVLPDLAQAFVADPRHAAVHVVWGLAMLLTLGARASGARALISLTLLFGVFYTALGVLGVILYHPFGLHLGPGENVFHLVVGPTALVVGWRGRRAG
jgi:hypothetical protein